MLKVVHYKTLLNHKIMAKIIETACELAPMACPTLDGSNYLRPDQTPYLKVFIVLAKKQGYTNLDILNSWNDVYAIKCGVDLEIAEDDELTKAVEKLFEHLNAHEMKLHYAARIDCMNLER